MEQLTPCPPFWALYFCNLHILHAKESNLFLQEKKDSIRAYPYFKSLYPFNIHENLIIYDFFFQEGCLWKYNI